MVNTILFFLGGGEVGAFQASMADIFHDTVDHFKLVGTQPNPVESTTNAKPWIILSKLLKFETINPCLDAYNINTRVSLWFSWEVPDRSCGFFHVCLGQSTSGAHKEHNWAQRPQC